MGICGYGFTHLPSLIGSQHGQLLGSGLRVFGDGDSTRQSTAHGHAQHLRPNPSTFVERYLLTAEVWRAIDMAEGVGANVGIIIANERYHILDPELRPFKSCPANERTDIGGESLNDIGRSRSVAGDGLANIMIGVAEQGPQHLLIANTCNLRGLFSVAPVG